MKDGDVLCVAFIAENDDTYQARAFSCAILMPQSKMAA
jgi:hypothetical protein